MNTILRLSRSEAPDYSHLVGKFVKFIDINVNDGIYTSNKWYKVVNDKRFGIGIEDDLGDGSYCSHNSYTGGTNEEMQSRFLAQFDLSNPLDHNPEL